MYPSIVEKERSITGTTTAILLANFPCVNLVVGRRIHPLCDVYWSEIKIEHLARYEAGLK
jgi:hypothetical protein